MAIMNVNPTRMQMTKLKKQLQIARRGHKMLKDKRDELMRQFIELVRETRKLREKVEEQLENLKTVNLLKGNLKIPFLFLSGGECHILRRIGGAIGCCMYLCVYEHDELATPQQPLLKNLKEIRNNIKR